ncbi:hypothetical protein KAM448_05910 [Aeromonas caviae]|uniref:Uncharacterized protein n=2 Tax=Aeromonas caviae TaxID=648 RepID=A0ABD0BA00_AERCA|nr:hypothetical protein [Aeromonas caviae]BCR29881.1 hypothetical protein KAM376_28870 [Aeromonas caviae]GJA80987.1 hypothetical protein KAM355_15470 [Aeromonas caviae]GJA98435.1 hypothetical protein KAM359_18430 [Aeromonas caviae]GJB10804.1 hypothetical protein KAM362_13640 [Aeromonas caviae]GJB23421.1 hypothetical protein KAM365_11710 [Aeromonas caviae]
MSVSGLAEGFLAGFNTMDRYQRGQKEDERQERELGLRDAMVKQNKENSDRDFSLRKATFDNSVEQQKTAKEQWGQEFDLKKKEAGSLRAYRNANLVLAQAAEGRAKQENDWQVKDREKQEYQRENLPIIQSGWQAVADGKDPGEKFWEVVRDPRAGSFNPERYLQQDYAEAGKTFVTYAGNLVRQAQEGKLDPTTPEGHAAINNPDFIKAAGTLYQDEVSKGVGDIDPESGKTITGKQLNNIMITPDGRGVVLGVEVTYDDGSKAVRPVTNNRTSAPDDHPKVIPINDFLKPAYQRAALAKHMIGNADQLRTSLGLTAGPDQVGYKKAVTELEKQHGQNRARISSSNAEDKDIQLDALDAQLEQSKAALADTFGMTSKAEEKEAGTPIKEWTGGDPERLQFVKEANQHGKLSSLLDSPARMNTAFELWRQQAAKQRQTEQATVTANRLRDTETNAYQAMSLAQARK